MLPLLSEAAAHGEFPSLYAAYLEDCILLHEGRLLKYGVYSDWDEHGNLSILPIEDEATVDHRRSLVGLMPIESQKAELKASKEQPPKNFSEKQLGYNLWRKRVGWIK